MPLSPTNGQIRGEHCRIGTFYELSKSYTIYVNLHRRRERERERERDKEIEGER